MATSFFFTNTSVLSSNYNQGFGPIDDDKFRVTSTFTNIGSAKAYAVTDGHLFIVPNAGDSEKVNVVLKPLNPLYMGVKIKYFIYRGIKKNNFYKTFDGVNKVTGSDDPDATPLITQLWDDFSEFNASNPDEDFMVSYIGVDPEITTNEKIIKKFFNQNTYSLPKVKEGQHIGWFNGTLGFDVVVDFGDYVQDIEESGFKLDVNYLTATECILNIAANNPDNVSGDKPESVDSKIFRENIFMFLDPAAFYGAHISLESLQSHEIRKRSNINIIRCQQDINQFNPTELMYVSAVYNQIVDNFITKNTIYLYVLGKRGRSVDYYNPSGSSNTHSGVANFLKTMQWPVRIIKLDALWGISSTNKNFYRPEQSDPLPLYGTFPNPEETLYFQLKFSLTKSEDWDSFFYVNNPMNPKKLIEKKHVSSGENGDTIITLSGNSEIELITPARIDNLPNGNNPNYTNTDHPRMIVSTFFYAFYEQVKLLSSDDDSYKDLFGPVDLDPVFEPNDYENASNLIQTVVYKKLKVVNFNNSKYLNQTYVVFDTAGSTRLYLSCPVDTAEKGFVPSTREFVPKYTLNYDINKIFNINDSLLGNGLRFWKSQKVVNGNTINYLNVSGNGVDYDIINQSFMLGITDAQYTSLMNLNPDDEKLNVYFELQYFSLNEEIGIYSAEVGIKYEKSNSEIVTVFPDIGSEIIVYSGNGLIFTSNEFVNNFNYYSTLAQTTMTFLPKDSWKGIRSDVTYGIGEYGIDWMRTEPLSSTNTFYPPFKDITGVVTGQISSNDFEGPGISFEPRPQMYIQLKTQVYDALLVPWGTSPNDEYFSSWLRLGRTEEAILKLKININTVPDKLAIRYEGDKYKITVYDGTNEVGTRQDLPNKVTDYVLPGTLFTASSINESFTMKISRLPVIRTKANDENRRIEVFATETINGQSKEAIAGMLKLFQEPVRNINILFVMVKIKNPDDSTKNAEITELAFNKQRLILQRYLHQSGIQANIASYDKSPLINVSSDPKFLPNGQYIVSDPSNGKNFIAGRLVGAGDDPPGYQPIKKYLRSLLPTAERNPANVPKSTMIVYIVAWRAKKKDKVTGLPVGGTGQFLGGFSSGENTDAIMFYGTDPDGNPVTDDINTMAHEVYHSLGVNHTFDSTERFCFQPKKTDNIMDYTELDTHSFYSQPSTYYWQWLRARNIANSWEREED